LSRSDHKPKDKPTCALSPAVTDADQSPERAGVVGGLSRSDQKNEKAARQRDGLFFQGRIVQTDLQKTIRTFWQKSYWPLNGSVKEFFGIKCLCFQHFI
jgi:hypothetical protein